MSFTALKPFPDLQEQAQIPEREIFHYLQISNFFAFHIRDRSDLANMTLFEGMCTLDPHFPGIISKLYAHLTMGTSPLPPYVSKWALDLGVWLKCGDWYHI